MLSAHGARDPRAPWALSIVYRALVPYASVNAQPGKRVEALKWFPVDALPASATLAFDHVDLIADAVAETRETINALDLPSGFLPQEFTLGELQDLCEQILGRHLDKSSFRRRLRESEVLELVDGRMRTGPFRPAQLYRLAATRVVT